MDCWRSFRPREVDWSPTSGNCYPVQMRWAGNLFVVAADLRKRCLDWNCPWRHLAWRSATTSLHGIWLHSETLIAHLEALHLPEHGLERLFLLILGLRLSEASKVVLVLNITFSDHAIERGVLVIGRVRVWVVHLIQVLNIYCLLCHVRWVRAALHVYSRRIIVALEVAESSVISSRGELHLIWTIGTGAEHIHEICIIWLSIFLWWFIEWHQIRTSSWGCCWHCSLVITWWLLTNLFWCYLRLFLNWFTFDPFIVTRVLLLCFYILICKWFVSMEILLPIFNVFLEFFGLILIQPSRIIGPLIGVSPLLADILVF